jgi:hypothetical protein
VTEAQRERLSNRRGYELPEFTHGDFGCTVGIGRFDDGPIAEIFLNVDGKFGTAVEISARDGAVTASILFQHGGSLEILRRALTRNGDGSAAGPLGRLLDLLAIPVKGPIALSASQPRCGASFSSPSSAAMKSATLRLDHTPPSGGGSRSRILSFSSRLSSPQSVWRRQIIADRLNSVIHQPELLRKLRMIARKVCLIKNVELHKRTSRRPCVGESMCDR